MFKLFIKIFLFLGLFAVSSGVFAMSDLDRTFYRDSIEALISQGIVAGYPDGTFRPRNLVNRAEMMKIIIGKSVKSPSASCFSDVKIAEWYTPYICTGYEKGIVAGYPDGTFRPSKNINFAEAVKIISIAFQIPVDKNTTPWYQGYIDAVDKVNILSKNSALPDLLVRREMMADMVYRAILYKEKGIGSTSLLYKSRGCSKSPPSIPPSTILSKGVSRSFITYIPSDYSASNPKKLIIAFHGRTSPNTQVRQYYELEKYGKNEYIIIYPSGLPAGSGRSWSSPKDSKDDLRDYELFDKILLDISDKYCIDKREIYVVGHSLGAWFTNSLACARGDVIRGTGSLGGSTTVVPCSGPVASIILHNPADRLSPFASGLFARDIRLQQNSCVGEPVANTRTDYNCMVYNSCAVGNPVVWCPHNKNYGWKGQYYPHNWPQGTGGLILDFFKELK